MNKVPARLLSRNTLAGGEIWFEARKVPGGYTLNWPRAGRAFISEDGRTRRVTPASGADPLSVHMVRRWTTAYAGSAAGREMLHATALSGPHGSVAFLGESGAGKSTLGHYLMRHGWDLISDDTLRISARRATIHAEPGSARLKLRGIRPAPRGALYDPNLEKYVLLTPPVRRPQRLRAILRLDRRSRGRVRADRLTHIDAALILAAGAYNLILRPRRVRKQQFHWAASLAERIPVWRLRYPTGKRNLPKVAAVVMQVVRDPSARTLALSTRRVP